MLLLRNPGGVPQTPARLEQRRGHPTLAPACGALQVTAVLPRLCFLNNSRLVSEMGLLWMLLKVNWGGGCIAGGRLEWMKSTGLCFPGAYQPHTC